MNVNGFTRRPGRFSGNRYLLLGLLVAVLAGSAPGPANAAAVKKYVITPANERVFVAWTNFLSAGPQLWSNKACPHVHAGHHEHDLANLEDRYARPVAGEPHDRLLALAAQSGPQAIHRQPHQAVTCTGAVAQCSIHAGWRAATDLHACSAGDDNPNRQRQPQSRPRRKPSRTLR